MESEVVERLSSLVNAKSPENLIKFISRHGVIAGGSMVYALNDFVPKESVGDIDVFVKCKTDTFRILHYLRKNYRTLEILRDSYKYSDMNHIISIISVYLEAEPVFVQLIQKTQISQERNYALEVISSFDFDYVRCAYYQGKVYKTKECQRSHSTREVITVCSSVDIKRITKIYRKGFRIRVEEGDDATCRCENRKVDSKTLMNYLSASLIFEKEPICKVRILRQLHSIRSKFLKEETERRLVHAKYSAYRAFEWKFSETNQIELSVKYACAQMKYDYQKIIEERTTFGGVPTNSMPQNTIQEMIDFIG